MPQSGSTWRFAGSTDEAHLELGQKIGSKTIA
jgi:hypothetical protein